MLTSPPPIALLLGIAAPLTSLTPVATFSLELLVLVAKVVAPSHTEEVEVDVDFDDKALRDRVTQRRSV